MAMFFCVKIRKSVLVSSTFNTLDHNVLTEEDAVSTSNPCSLKTYSVCSIFSPKLLACLVTRQIKENRANEKIPIGINIGKIAVIGKLFFLDSKIAVIPKAEKITNINNILPSRIILVLICLKPIRFKSSDVKFVEIFIILLSINQSKKTPRRPSAEFS